MSETKPFPLKRRMWHEPATEGCVPLAAPRVMDYKTWKKTEISGVLDPDTFDLMGPRAHPQFAYGDLNPFWDPSWGTENDFLCVFPSEREQWMEVGNQVRFRLTGRLVEVVTMRGECIGEMSVTKGGRREDAEIIRSTGLDTAVVVVTSKEEFRTNKLIIGLFAAPKIELVVRPWFGDGDYDWFMTNVVWPARAARWPLELEYFRSRLDGNSMRTYDKYSEAIDRAYRLRELHPDAREDVVALCRECIVLAKSNRAKLRRRLAGTSEQPQEFSFHRLILTLEAQGRFKEALEVYDEGDECDFFRNTNVRKRLERKLQKTGP